MCSMMYYWLVVATCIDLYLPHLFILYDIITRNGSVHMSHSVYMHGDKFYYDKLIIGRVNCKLFCEAFSLQSCRSRRHLESKTDCKI